jgi:hypothetical protein
MFQIRENWNHLHSWPTKYMKPSAHFSHTLNWTEIGIMKLFIYDDYAMSVCFRRPNKRGTESYFYCY